MTSGPDPISRPVHSFPPLGYPLVFDQPRRLSDVDSWHEHIPFAFFTVAALRPRVLVELGTWKGDSYCAFCQAVQTLGLPTQCYAVDTWEGDEHTGAYGPEILEELRAHHDPLYGSFSRLLRQTFDGGRALRRRIRRPAPRRRLPRLRRGRARPRDVASEARRGRRRPAPRHERPRTRFRRLA